MHGFGRCIKTIIGAMPLFLVVLALSLGAATTAGAAEKEKPWYGSLWPLGEKVPVRTLSKEYIPFKGKSEIPNRPALLLELGDPFLDTGKLDAGFKVPIIGAVWQPRLWSYLINRATVQTFDNGAPGRLRDTEVANRMDLYVNLQLTGTEKILLGLRPFDNNQPGRFTRYTFDGSKEGFQNELNFDVETLFFEGDLGSLFPNLDRAGIKPVDYGFTVGRQPFTFQEGIIINDTLDAVGFIRNNIVVPGTSNFRVSGLWGWNRLDRNDATRDSDTNLFALFILADTDISTYNLDMIYVNDDANDNNGDAVYIGVSAIQRIRAWGGISTAFRINNSIALDDEISGNVSGTGTLLSAEISSNVAGSDDIAYFNSFLGINNFTQAGREAILGGPLASLGILFASPNLSTYGAEISPFTDDVVGFAAGYQAFWDHHRRNLILEIAARHDTDGKGFDQLGLGFQLQQAVGRYAQLQLEGFHTFNEGRDNGSGARFELLVVY